MAKTHYFSRRPYTSNQKHLKSGKFRQLSAKID